MIPFLVAFVSIALGFSIGRWLPEKWGALATFLLAQPVFLAGFFTGGLMLAAAMGGAAIIWPIIIVLVIGLGFLLGLLIGARSWRHRGWLMGAVVASLALTPLTLIAIGAFDDANRQSRLAKSQTQSFWAMLGDEPVFLPLAAGRFDVRVDGMSEPLGSFDPYEASRLAKRLERAEGKKEVKSMTLFNDFQRPNAERFSKTKLTDQEPICLKHVDHAVEFWCNPSSLGAETITLRVFDPENVRDFDVPSTPTQDGLLELDVEDADDTYTRFLLPLTETADANGNPVYTSCSLPQDDGLMTCHATFAIRPSVAVLAKMTCTRDELPLQIRAIVGVAETAMTALSTGPER